MPISQQRSTEASSAFNVINVSYYCCNYLYKYQQHQSSEDTVVKNKSFGVLAKFEIYYVSD